MPVISLPVLSGIATTGWRGEIETWKLAMTPENIRPLLEGAMEVHARLCDCVEDLGGYGRWRWFLRVFLVCFRSYVPRRS